VPPLIVEYALNDLFSKSTKPAVEISSPQFGDLRGISFDKGGNLWVADMKNGVDEFTSEQLAAGGPAEPHLSIQSDLVNPVDLAFDPQGNLWVAYLHGPTNPTTGIPLPGEVRRYSASELLGTGAISLAGSISIGGPVPCSPLDVCHPERVVFDSKGDLWVSSGQIFEYTPKQLTQSGSPLAQVTLATDAFRGSGGLASRRLNFISPSFLSFGPPIGP
jgi:hypothetical protein